MLQQKKIIPLPFAVYFWTVAGAAIAGLIDAVYLSISHYRVYTDMGYQSFCAVSRAINCDTVSQSPYSILWGLPVSVWGVLGYAFFVLLLPSAYQKNAEHRRIWPFLFLISLAFTLYSVALALISTYQIGSYCILCILSYGVNLLLLYYTWLIRKRFGDNQFFEALKLDFQFLWNHQKRTAFVSTAFVVAVVLAWIYFPSYWNFGSPRLSEDIPTGITADGHPWIGAENPLLEITEFTDYQCFQCKKMHYHLRQLVAEYPNVIRLIHRHYPMDHRYNFIVKQPFHVGSGDMALLAIYATSQGKFWEMNDLLYEMAGKGDTLKIKELAEQIGLNDQALSSAIYEPQSRHKLKLDVWQGMKLRISGTPAYVVNNEVYLGQIPADFLRKFLDKLG